MCSPNLTVTSEEYVSVETELSSSTTRIIIEEILLLQSESCALSGSRQTRRRAYEFLWVVQGGDEVIGSMEPGQSEEIDVLSELELSNHIPRLVPPVHCQRGGGGIVSGKRGEERRTHADKEAPEHGI